MVSNMAPAAALWDENVLRAISAAARKVASRHSGYVEVDDLQSEGYEWVLKHPDKMNGFLAEEHGFGYLQVDLHQHMHKFAMKQRYLKDGTEPGDYFLYPLAVLADLLPVVLCGPDAVDVSPSDLNSKIRANRPVNERGDRAAMVADVQRAFKALDNDDKALLLEKYGPNGATDDVIGERMGKPQQTVNYQLHRALRRMAAFLGGEPWARRKAMSNARAQQETRDQT